MNPSGRTAADLNEYPLSLVELGEDGGSPSENRENGFVGRRSRAKVDTSATNDPSTSVARHDLGLDECGLRGLEIRLKSRNLLHQLRSALGLSFTKALRLFDIDAKLIRFGSAGRLRKRIEGQLETGTSDHHGREHQSRADSKKPGRLSIFWQVIPRQRLGNQVGRLPERTPYPTPPFASDPFG